MSKAKRNPVEWWNDLPVIARILAQVVLLLTGGGAVAIAGGEDLLPRLQRLEAAIDTTHESRIRELEEWQKVDRASTRFTVCRFRQEDRGLDPKACELLLEPFEELFSLPRADR